ncbi:MAG: hypothetical protein EBS55_08435 [Flavobacteriaceae bacterium]|jgi:hypothetical protein|nr:hypothetical protein [Flavobacteriaceae bacterium]
MTTTPCFIIAHKWVRGYTSYIKHYVDNIKSFYRDSLILIVDNNSEFKEDVLDVLKNTENVILLNNNTEYLFEQGAYLFGLDYLLKEDLVKYYDYFVFTQDTYILKNKFNFDELIQKKVLACPISWGIGTQDFPLDHILPHLQLLEVYDENLELNTDVSLCHLEEYEESILKKILHCYCTCYIIHTSKLNELFGYLKKIKITTRWESELGERYFAWVLYKMNGNKNYQIDRCPYLYDHRGKDTIDLHKDFHYGYFAKHQQGKNENTLQLMRILPLKKKI